MPERYTEQDVEDEIDRLREEELHALDALDDEEDI